MSYPIQYMYLPELVEQGRIFPHTCSHVGTGSKQDILSSPSGSNSEMGVAPQGQVVTAEGRRGQDGHAPS